MPRPSHRSGTARSGWRLGAGIALWGGLLACGFGALVSYEMRPGSRADAPLRWPRESKLQAGPHRYSLVMFAHPKCPCSRASLANLESLLVAAPGEISMTICFYDPAGETSEWAETRLVRTARAIPGLKVVLDRDGQLAVEFGAKTSGQVLVFDRDGRQVFDGGLTSARGHEGEDQGGRHLLALARGETRSPLSTPVYGCALREKSALAAQP
ncbi:MAG: hypothetical protein JWM88_2314 [Verrucomicrobia bacterium]|nr:hypothetical protein [Verrucomicrobiota bacterium]